MKQNLSNVICAIIVALSVLCAVTETKADDSVGLEISATWVSKYIWRGIDQLDDDDAIQPSITYALGDTGLSFNVWGSYGLDSSENLDEVDYIIDYTFSASDGVDISTGLIYYWLDEFDNTTEVYAAVTLTRLPLTPSLTIYYDIDEADGAYINLAGTYDLLVTETQAVSLGAAIGVWSGYAGIDDGFGDLDLSASTSFDLGGGVTISPEVHYILVDDDSVNSEDEFWVGVGIGTSF
jgi:uncharacterized protein (TIGR02001 family)